MFHFIPRYHFRACGMKRNGTNWNAMKRNETQWNAMKRNGMQWNAMGATGNSTSRLQTFSRSGGVFWCINGVRRS
jgi:hypothetical protein